jgi:ABC-type lipoprotein export system ATPase subunit/GNAT superfamily N-acetyltransferase
MLDELAKQFDFDRTRKVEPIDFTLVHQDFALGCIVGSSGSGKSTILRNLSQLDPNFFFLETKVEWVLKDSLASYFASKEEAIARLSAAGLSSVPSWFQSYETLSAGEKFRATLARGLDNYCIIDEFSSNLDRLTARSVAKCLSKYVRKHHLHHVIVATCHWDILKWLAPDWLYNSDTSTFLPSPSLEATTWTVKSDVYDIDKMCLKVQKCARSRWSCYKTHHYLSGNILDNALCWEASLKVEDYEQAVGFIAVIPMPGKMKRAYREHRLVVLPAAQGLGIGVVLSETIAEVYLKEEKRYFARTSHPRLGEWRERSLLWRPTAKNKKVRTSVDIIAQTLDGRACYSHEYIGITKAEPVLSLNLDEEEWLPLRFFGTLVELANGTVYTLIKHKKTRFSPNEHKHPVQAAEKFLCQSTKAEVLSSKTHGKKTNLYRKVEGGVEVVAFVPSSPKPYFLLLDSDDVPKIKDHYWFIRMLGGLPHGYTKVNSKRVIIGDFLSGKKVVYQDKNPLNNHRSNLTSV